MLSRVKIPARYRDANGREHFSKTEFRLGVGPCEKEVVGFETDNTFSAFVLRQFHSDGTSKVFLYPWATICGRVETETERNN